MTKDDLKFKDVVHCKSSSEFDRMIELFKMDNEYLMWEVYEENTVLFPFDDQYGEVNGHCKEINANVINSEEIFSNETES